MLLLLLAVAALESLVVCGTRILNAGDFIEFLNDVNSGNFKNYKGTVFLDSDIDLAGEGPHEFVPIGVNATVYFRGTFDGRGHVISNYVVNSSTHDKIGFFGYSRGIAVKNLVVDSSCSMVSSYRGSDPVYVGGVICQCYVGAGSCSIENVVSLASVAFNGSTTSDVSLGGIAGSFYYYNSNYESVLKNCANYGTVMSYGESSKSFIGGIIGRTYMNNNVVTSKKVLVQNCLNSGPLTCIGVENELHVGGNVGRAEYVKIENCVSTGPIVVGKSYSYIGTFAGSASSASVAHSLWTSSVRYNKTCEYGTLSMNNPISQTSLDTSVLNELNNYSDSNGWNRWLLNLNSASVTFKINKENSFIVNSQIVLLPTSGNSSDFGFNGWYSDEGLTRPFILDEVTVDTTLYGSVCESNFTVTLDVNGGSELSVKELTIECNGTYENLPTPTKTEAAFDGWFTKKDGGDKVEINDKVIITRDHILYARWTSNKYSVTFIFDNGSEPEVRTFDFNEDIAYPEDVAKIGYLFNGWNNSIVSMPANNLTIMAQWTPRNYTVTFDLNGGVEIPVNEAQVTFDGSYGSLPTPNRSGYAFLGWFTGKNESVTEESIVKIPDNHTLQAQWSKNEPGKVEVPINGVEIVFGSKDMTKEELEDIMSRHTKAEYEILIFENDGTSETRVIIKFTDSNEAKNFVESIKESNGSLADLVKFVDYNSGGIISFSMNSYPMALFSIIVF